MASRNAGGVRDRLSRRVPRPRAVPSLSRWVTIALGLGIGIAAQAQQAPDAGRVLQEQQSIPTPPATRPAPALNLPLTSGAPVTPGGPRVSLRAVRFAGNTRFETATLQAELGDISSTAFDLAALHELAERVSAFYRRAGFPFARAILPVQSLTEGELRIEIVEGRYGQVRAVGEADLVARAQAFLDASLVPGAVIQSQALERATLILDDQPGIRVTPVIRLGRDPGTGDLDVRIDRTPHYKGDIGYDNHGNRYTGEHRARFNLSIDSPFTLGDQISLRAMHTNEGQTLGHLGYALPIGGTGLRGNVSHSRTYYALGQDFSSLNASGTADVSSAGFTYPLVRSQALNLTLAASLQHKKLYDRQGTVGTDDGKLSNAVPLSLQFDGRDARFGSAITYGVISFTQGELSLGVRQLAADTYSGVNSEGRFGKWNLDIARIQSTPIDSLSLFARLSQQWSNKNLDSSEKQSLGGPAAVRAFPVGEASGDQAWVAQFEARWSRNAVSPYLFHDLGAVQSRSRPLGLRDSPGSNRRSIAGSGIGTRFSQGDLSADLAIAWRVRGEVPQADKLSRDPRVWLTVAHRF